MTVKQYGVEIDGKQVGNVAVPASIQDSPEVRDPYVRDHLRLIRHVPRNAPVVKTGEIRPVNLSTDP